MPPMSEVEVFAAIRRDSRVGMSVRALARTCVHTSLVHGTPLPCEPLWSNGK